MSTTTFDKLAYSEALKAGGVSHEQATTHANALDTALKDSVATQHDIQLLEQRIIIRIGGMIILAVGVMIAAMAIIVKLL